MKRIALACVSLAVLSMGIGCCGMHGGYGGGCCGGGGGGGYQPYSQGCPGGNCGLGYQGAAPTAYAPAATMTTAAPGYYTPYTTAAVNHLPTY